jgi:hypothetical protein
MKSRTNGVAFVDRHTPSTRIEARLIRAIVGGEKNYRVLVERHRGDSYRAIAEREGITPQAVHQRVSIANRKLREAGLAAIKAAA